VKQSVVKLCREASRREVAARVGVARARLARWERAEPDRRTGRPLATLDTATEGAARVFLDENGPATGTPRLVGAFPEASPRALGRLLQRFRRERVRGRRQLVSELTWKTPRAVWAIDFTEPPAPIDGVYRQILSVRDLASAKHLIAAPVLHATAEATCAVLSSLFAEHGPPLVIKSDNGSHFTASQVAATLEASGVLQLLSPPRTPRYNGSCEAGIGALKLRALHEAARHGRYGEWTCDDVAAACELGNATGRPWGARRPTPNEAWAASRELGRGERRSFLADVRRLEDEARRSGSASNEDKRAADRIKRDAIRRALGALGYLVVRRRRIRLPIWKLLRSRIS
jgi:transposase InsO family protein